MALESRIFLDLDGVLIRSCTAKEAWDRLELISSLTEVAPTYNGIVSALRPGAREFLDGVSKLGKVYLLTAAQLSYAKSIIKAFDLAGYFANYYTTVYHTQNSIAHELNLNGTPWVLVEDSPITLDITRYKMGSLGMTEENLKNSALVDKHYIEVKSYQPQIPGGDVRLDDYLCEVEDKIHYLEKRLILF